jgi:hypothetical protein
MICSFTNLSAPRKPIKKQPLYVILLLILAAGAIYSLVLQRVLDPHF